MSEIRVALDAVATDDNRARWRREQELLVSYNDPRTPWPEREAALAEMLGELGEGSSVSSPVYLSRGSQIRIGRKVFINFGVTLSGMADITIGDYTLIAPNVQLHTVTHPVDPYERQQVAFIARPITIGQNVWIGAGAIICPGVTIGDHSVIGAGSVVTRDVPACTFAAGNPCRVIRELDPPDMATLYARRQGDA
ncbi:sugar O-acetyltransferase [Chitinibacteraceae bacterium HSL-7]